MERNSAGRVTAMANTTIDVSRTASLEPQAAAPAKVEPGRGAARRTTAWRWTAVLVPGVLLWFAPIAVFSPPQRHLLAIFVATIVAVVAHPVPMAVGALLGMTLLPLTGTLPPARVLTGFSNLTVWLVFTAFLFARALTVTGFGQRVAYFFIHRFGRSPITLGYSLCASDVALAPFIPSDTARGGGIIFPVARSVALAAGSEPGSNDASDRLGAFLMLVGFHTSYITSAMFLTAMAANPLVAEFAAKRANVDLTWGRWFVGALVPALISLICLPPVLRRLTGLATDARAATAIREHAGRELATLGRLRRKEWWLVVVMLAVMAGWITSPWHKMHNTIVALAGVCTLLLAGVLSWDDLLAQPRAWDVLIWFAALLMMADALNEAGVVRVLSGALFARLGGWPWAIAFPAIVIAYLYIHYGFASMTAHVTALYPSFIGAAVLAGAPPLVAALALAYFSNLNGGLTHYSTGPAPIYFGAGYVSQGRWWKVGFLVSLLNVVIWLGVGMLWWKVLGWW